LKTAALIFGLLAGLLGGLALVFGNIETSLTGIPALGANGTLIVKFVLYLVPAIGWIGTGIVLARPRTGGFVLLVCAAAWAVLAFAAGHGAVFFAAAPFIFAVAAGVVAMFARRGSDRQERPAPAAPAKRPSEAMQPVQPAPAPKASPLKPLPPRSTALPPPASGADADANANAPIIPPPFRDDIPTDEPAVGKLAEDDPAAPIVAAIATRTVAVVPDSGASVSAPLEAAETLPAVPSPAALAPTSVPADPEAAELRARRPSDWSLPSPADAPAPRYVAERQVAIASISAAAPLPPAEGPSKVQTPAPAAQVTVPTPEPGSVPAPAVPQLPEPMPAIGTLDFAPTDDYGRGGRMNEAAQAKGDETIPAPLQRTRRRPFGSRHADTAEADDTPLPPPRANGLRRFLRGTIAAVFVIAVVAGCGAAYLDYLRGPQSILFGRRAPFAIHHTEAAAQAIAPAAAKPALAAPPPAKPAAATPAPAARAPMPQASTPAAKAPEAVSAAVAAPASQTTAAAAPVAAQNFSDPVRYCAAVRTIDAPDSRYAGPAVPPAVATALLLPKSADPSQVHWRCSGGVAFACNANNTDACSPTPTVQYMLQYCGQHPGAASMPAPNGSWSCNGTRPVIPADQSWPVDARGFFPDAWVRVSPIGAG